MDKQTEEILRRRVHGLYLSRKCEDIEELSRELMGLHCWFHRNVAFSALIRGADLAGWKTVLTKTWLYRGTLHGVDSGDLPNLLALHAGGWRWEEQYREIAERAVSLIEDGVYSRTEMRQIFAGEYEPHIIDMAFSSWGGVFCELARNGRVAFRDMTSRDFDLIDAQPTRTFHEVLPELFRRFIAVYGPATLEDAMWFFGISKEQKDELYSLNLEEYSCFEYNKNMYYYTEVKGMGDIPELTLLSGFDPFIVSYMNRSAVLPGEYKSTVILKSGICLPTIAVNGQVAGLWNIKKGSVTAEFFSNQPKRIRDEVFYRAEEILRRTKGEI